jgi:phosphoribosylformylglycinamidine cyclo-ligase
VGIDLVAMSVNDVVVQGAEPLFFLDYFACGKLDVDTAARVIGGVARGCEIAGCALIGGETAEMPGMYPAGEYDLAGFAVGIAEHDALITLIRRILEQDRTDLAGDFHGRPLGDVLLEPTRIYARPLLELMKRVTVKGLAHITGGGLLENVPRVLPEGLAAELERAAWPRPPIFDWLQARGDVADAEMHRVFNCGIGMVIILAPGDVATAMACLGAQGETVFEIGRIVRRAEGEPATRVR